MKVNPRHLFLAAIAIFLAVNLSQTRYYLGDENTYLYMGKMIAEGTLPYRDFYYANLPLQILLIAGLTALGLPVLWIKTLPIFASAATASMIFLGLKDEGGLEASVLYMFSYLILATTDIASGVALVAMFIVASFFAVKRGKFFLGGLLAALAMMTRLYAPFAIAGMVAYMAVRRNWRELGRFLLGIAALFAPAVILLSLAFGSAFLEPVFFFRFLVVFQGISGIPKITILRFLATNDFWLLTLVGLAIMNERKLGLDEAAAISVSLFFLLYKDFYTLYLAMLIPFFAIIAGKHLRTYGKVALAVLLVSSAYNVNQYLHKDAKMGGIPKLDEMGEFIVSGSGADDRIYGSFEIAPLLALTTGRGIIDNLIDTNNKNFMTGVFNVSTIESRLLGRVKYIVTNNFVEDGRIKTMSPEITIGFLDANCEVARVYDIPRDYDSNAVVIWDCG